MLLMSKTKTLFQKTLQNFKSLLYGRYQRLPKTSPFMKPIFCGCGGSLKIHGSFKDDEKEPMKENKVENESFMKLSKESISTSRKQESLKQRSCQLTSRRKVERREGDERKRKGKGCGNEEEKCCERSVKEAAAGNRGSNYLVAKKLRELELIMDMNTDVEHVLDIEELVHYYSRLKCPVYLDIVDKFFTDMYSEFFQSRTSTCNNNLRKLRVMKS